MPSVPILTCVQGLEVTRPSPIAQLIAARRSRIAMRAAPSPPRTRDRPRLRVFASRAVLPSRIATKVAFDIARRQALTCRLPRSGFR